MEVLVDTSVWSIVLRRTKRRTAEDSRIESQLRQLVLDGRVAVIGPIRQELLSGIRSPKTFNQLRDYLRYFPEPPLDNEDYETAAEFSNKCSAAGIQGSGTDFLICAAAVRRGWEVFTTDRDFEQYASILPLKQYAIG